MLAVRKSKSCASPKVGGNLRKHRRFHRLAAAGQTDVLNFAGQRRKSPADRHIACHPPTSLCRTWLSDATNGGVMKGTVLRYQDMNESKRTNSPPVHTTRLSIVGMSCGACVRHVTKALNGVTGVVHIDVDLAKNEAVVVHLLGRVDEAGLIAAISETGYQAGVLASRVGHDELVSEPAPARRSTGCCCG
ncbi:MAG TPA: heavy-metal-associated domain-containing protein [Gemmatimonadaceae bacterium]|nr:heavy-metal-associated domain-containing protein [Gemmatimonadaceae bacterium]